jgi:hypothetical protein
VTGHRTLALIGVVASVALANAAADAAETATLPLHEVTGLSLVNVDARPVRFRDRDGLEVSISAKARAALVAQRAEREAAGAQAPPSRSDHLVLVPGQFQDGTIEVELAGEPAPGASGEARGFVGVAFRVRDDLATYECFYLRPANGRAEDQERRNHSAQYVSHPDFPWYRLRQETPSRYEAYVDIVPGAWIPIRIDVEGNKARLFVDGNAQPTLIVNDLKLGADGRGSAALWIEGSTIAHFRNLRITPGSGATANSGGSQ